jgi:hypothetical protein
MRNIDSKVISDPGFFAKAKADHDKKQPTWINGADLQHIQEGSQVIMAVENILPSAALTLASAKPKAGKTTFAISLCYAVATGKPFLGELRVRQSPVCYWCPDDSNVDRFKRNWANVAAGDPVNNFHLCVMRQQLPDGFTLLENAITAHKAGLALVDSYTTIRRTATGDFVQAEYSDLRTFSEIAVRTGAAIILIHHHAKATSDWGFDNAAGSFAMNASSDVLWSFERLDHSERILHVIGRDIESYDLVYRRDADKQFRKLIDKDAATHWRQLREALDGGLEPSFDAKVLAAALGVSPRQARRIAQQWLYADVIRRKQGDFALSPDVQKAIDQLQCPPLS